MPLECVGIGESLKMAMNIARPGSMVAATGAPHGIDLHRDSASVIEASDLDYTILPPGWFTQG